MSDFWQLFTALAKRAKRASAQYRNKAYVDAYNELLMHVVIHAPSGSYFAPPEMVEALKMWSRWDEMTELDLALAIEATKAVLAKAGADE